MGLDFGIFFTIFGVIFQRFLQILQILLSNCRQNYIFDGKSRKSRSVQKNMKNEFFTIFGSFFLCFFCTGLDFLKILAHDFWSFFKNREKSSKSIFTILAKNRRLGRLFMILVTILCQSARFLALTGHFRAFKARFWVILLRNSPSEDRHTIVLAGVLGTCSSSGQASLREARPSSGREAATRPARCRECNTQSAYVYAALRAALQRYATQSAFARRPRMPFVISRSLGPSSRGTSKWLVHEGPSALTHNKIASFLKFFTIFGFHLTIGALLGHFGAIFFTKLPFVWYRVVMACQKCTFSGKSAFGNKFFFSSIGQRGWLFVRYVGINNICRGFIRDHFGVTQVFEFLDNLQILSYRDSFPFRRDAFFTIFGPLKNLPSISSFFTIFGAKFG